MVRANCIPGSTLLGLAFILGFLASISVPYVRQFDIVRATFDGQPELAGVEATSEIRLGIWGYCYHGASTGVWACLNTGHGYALQVGDQVIAASWTRGLFIHTIATGVTFIALVLSCFQSLMLLLIASLTSFLAALLLLIAFICDIALFVHFKNKLGDIQNVQETVEPGPGFWLALASLLFLLVAGCTVCFARNRERVARGDSYPMSTTKPWYHKFTRR